LCVVCNLLCHSPIPPPSRIPPPTPPPPPSSLLWLSSILSSSFLSLLLVNPTHPISNPLLSSPHSLSFPPITAGTAPFKSVLTVLLRHATRSQLSDLFQNIIRPALQRVSDLTNATPEGDRSQTSTTNSLNNSLYNSTFISSDVIPSSCITNLNLNDSAVEKLGDREGAKMGGFGRPGIMKCSGSSNSSAAGNEKNTSHSRRHSYNNMSARNILSSHNMSRKNLYGSAVINSINSSLSNTNTGNNTQQNTTNNTQNNSANTSTHNSHNDSAFNSAPCSLCPSNIQTQKNSIDALEEGQIVKLDGGEDSSTQDDKSKNLSFTKNDSKLYSQGLPESSTIVYDQSIIDDFFTAIPADLTDRTKSTGKEDFLSRALEILNAGTHVNYYVLTCVFSSSLILIFSLC
jgi:hypothetical protein